MLFNDWLSKWIQKISPCTACDDSDADESGEIDLNTAIRNWRMCRDLADRYNRYLVQYGAAAATALGIAAATGGLFATADAVVKNASKTASLPDVISKLIWGLLGVSFAIFIASAILLLVAVVIRGWAENSASRHLYKLIELEPRRFLPSNEELRS